MLGLMQVCQTLCVRACMERIIILRFWVKICSKIHTYDITGSLCENNDKFAIHRELPKIEIGDLLVIHDAGAHGHAMGFNYNGKLRSAELLLRTDGSVVQIVEPKQLKIICNTRFFWTYII